MQFDSFDFHASVSANVKAMGYETPTPIQAEAIPHVMEGRDVMGLAQTGTGKTAAFLLPIIDRFLKNPKPMRGSARALVIAPTRELAEQIHESARELTKGMRFRSVTVYGGVGLGPQANNLRRGADLVVACPGRLLDHLNQGNANLSGVETLVLDEADHMFDMGFLPDIKKILAKLPAERQTLLFSATMPDSIRGLANETLNDPATVRIGRTAPACTIEQCLYPVQQHLKTKLLLTLLEENKEGSVLVFTRTKHRAKRLAEQLGRFGHQSSCIQGNLSQTQRQKAMDGFRTGKFRVLVATDIAARGIDVSRVAHVINYDLPDTPETYTHRVGRTGRAEREGQAHSLMTSEDVSMVKAIERLLGKPIERRKVEGFDYTAAAPERDMEFHRPPLAGGRGGQSRNARPASEAQGDSGQARRPQERRERSGGPAGSSKPRANWGQPGNQEKIGNAWNASGDQPRGRSPRAPRQGGQGAYGQAANYSQPSYGTYGRYEAEMEHEMIQRQYGAIAEGGQAAREADGNRAGNTTRAAASGNGQDARTRDNRPRQPRSGGNAGGFYGRTPEGASGNRANAQGKDRPGYDRPARSRNRQGGGNGQAA
ncbi:DEAD/DEAH box helicase [Fundidesulfovibrio terrae]|uniref:DEAD/DEAH box helicase n=1 Tax=Fundidesulfovibrio terrae TaxID=2922866 RepID=UPI00311AA652